MWALALVMELGPHRNRGKLWPNSKKAIQKCSLWHLSVGIRMMMAQLVECRTTVREIVGSSPGRSKTQGTELESAWLTFPAKVAHFALCFQEGLCCMRPRTQKQPQVISTSPSARSCRCRWWYWYQPHGSAESGDKCISIISITQLVD